VASKQQTANSKQQTAKDYVSFYDLFSDSFLALSSFYTEL